MINWFRKRRKPYNSKRSNHEWIDHLTAPQDDQAIADLRAILIQGLKSALYKYVDRELNPFVEDIAQDSLIIILDKIHTFRGESKFITWAMKIAVREGLSELRRKKWDDISLEKLGTTSQVSNDSEIKSLKYSSDIPEPDQTVHENIILQKVMLIIENELSEKQKSAIMSLMVKDIPITVVAEQMGMKRNALYKLVHDARVNIKKKMNQEGINPDHIFTDM
jgi:RNA polymerase sigma-70 factor, ECF subfamily